jgi:BMFP domain-containing protein YqiC
MGRISAENAALRQRIRDLTAGKRTLEERLQASRSNNRFLDKRIANLEAQLLSAEPGTSSGQP